MRVKSENFFKFSLLRTIITLPVFILLAQIMEVYLRDKNFEIKNP